MERGDVAEAWRQLNACRGDFRGWEHDYLYTLFTKNQRTLRAEGKVWSVAYNADGKRVAAATGHAVTIYDAGSGLAVFRLEPKVTTISRITSVAFSPDGKRIAAGTGWKTLHIWDAILGENVLNLDGVSDGGQICSVAFSPDGKRIARAGSDKLIKIWNATSGHQEFSLKGSPPDVTLRPYRDSPSVAFSPDGKRIAGAGAGKTITLWDTSSGRQLFTLKGHEGPVNCMAFSRDGKRIVSGSDDTTVRIWDASLGGELLVLKGHTDSVCGVTFDADGKRIASGGGLLKDPPVGCVHRTTTQRPERAFRSRHQCELQSGWQADRQRKRGPDRQDLGCIAQT